MYTLHSHIKYVRKLSFKDIIPSATHLLHHFQKRIVTGKNIICICVCDDMCVCVHVCTYIGIQKPEINVWCVLLVHSILFSNDRIPTEPRAHRLARLVGQ